MKYQRMFSLEVMYIYGCRRGYRPIVIGTEIVPVQIAQSLEPISLPFPMELFEPESLPSLLPSFRSQFKSVLRVSEEWATDCQKHFRRLHSQLSCCFHHHFRCWMVSR
jgi:hypothetical protein